MDNTLQGLFAGQVERTPHHIALEGIHRQDRQQCLSFGELNKKADQLAHYLGTLGVKENHLVGIMVERSIEMIIGILGVLKAGAGYVPVNSKEPSARSTYILDECNVKLLLTQSPLIAGQEAYNRYRCIVEYNNYSPGPGIDKPGTASRQSSTLAYVIFTSGSTGKPKGVPISHYNILPLLGWGIKYLGISVDDRALQNLAYYFDWSVWEIFINLISGARLYMVPDRVLLDPVGGTRFMEEHGITVLHVTPTQWQHLLTSGRGFEFLNYLFIGAERLTRELVQRSLQKVHRGCRVFNMYGPTEATIIASVLEIHRGDEKNGKNYPVSPLAYLSATPPSWCWTQP
jgi:tyrocidine synthetase-3